MVTSGGWRYVCECGVNYLDGCLFSDNFRIVNGWIGQIAMKIGRYVGGTNTISKFVHYELYR